MITPATCGDLSVNRLVTGRSRRFSMLALLAITCAYVDPIARHSEFVDELVERGQQLLKHAPPSTLRRTGVAISKIADSFPDSTFAAVANAAMERLSSAPTLSQLHKYTMNGQLTSVVRANARLLMWVPWRRKLQDTVLNFDLSSLLTSLQTGAVSPEINCASITPPATLTDSINDLVKAFPIDDFTADSTQVQTFVNDAWGCFCGLSLSGTAGDNIQAHTINNKSQHITP